jgi:hypothetical protein
MQAVSYSIKSTYFHQLSTDFNWRFDLVRDQVLYPDVPLVSHLYSISGSPQLLNSIESRGVKGGVKPGHLGGVKVGQWLVHEVVEYAG